MVENVTKLPFQPERVAISFQLGDKLIDSASVKQLMFQAFTEHIAEAQTLRQPKTWEGRLKRVRMVRQVTYYANGVQVPVTMADILSMPIPAARTIDKALGNIEEGTPGKVIREGDGIDKAIVFELGTPIPTGQGKPPIRELEFLAKTYGDIEDVLSAADSVQQTKYMIETLAKPLDSSLSALPSWGLTQITIADGMTMLRDVLPHFLGSPVES
jgi:hypothetical protein